MKNEQSMLKYITQLELPLVQKLQYSFQDNNALYLATVRFTDEESLNLILCVLGPLCLLTGQCYSPQIGRRQTLHQGNCAFSCLQLFLVFPTLHLTKYNDVQTEAVSGLHTLGIIHRNIRPDTAFLREDGHLILGGFEYASVGNVRCGDLSDDRTTISGERLRFASPETVLGWRHDRSVDVWSMGVLFYTLIVGKVSFPYQDY